MLIKYLADLKSAVDELTFFWADHLKSNILSSWPFLTKYQCRILLQLIDDVTLVLFHLLLMINWNDVTTDPPFYIHPKQLIGETLEIFEEANYSKFFCNFLVTWAFLHLLVGWRNTSIHHLSRGGGPNKHFKFAQKNSDEKLRLMTFRFSSAILRLWSSCQIIYRFCFFVR